MNHHRRPAWLASLALAGAALVGAAPAQASWNADHFLTSDSKVECKGIFLPDLQRVALTCANQNDSIVFVGRSGPAGLLSYDWDRNPFHYGRRAHVLASRDAFNGWGVRCTAGATYVKCRNGAGHGMVVSGRAIQTF